ncbi:esterase/lipase family protein [Vibrio rhizosphaerae]|uniref:Triacylglycerol lipase n=1 Tax=Vibrio rhizosphaerae TaxID=398736 RepID=A0ABU4IUI1_9VIBR|nr:cob(I)alamin adenolsyltransferase/cobinamide ATP-dependent adenolsyltransferase [Vibrio rhizosphaerae]MDW6092603.1 triacylglycerol lipase [Vibrio rhizosphaerae]
MKIILLHGLYMHGIALHPLRQRLNQLGYATEVLSYNTVAIDGEKLFSDIDAALDQSHVNILVGHSLGGVMIKNYLASRQPSVHQISHVVTIGSPLQGASIISKIQAMGFGMILGNAPDHGLQQHEDEWRFPQKLGSIAGTMAFGIRPLLFGNDAASDGTVTVEETKIRGMTDHLEICYAHTTMLYAQTLAAQIDTFIRHDRFQPES